MRPEVAAAGWILRSATEEQIERVEWSADLAAALHREAVDVVEGADLIDYWGESAAGPWVVQMRRPIH